MIFTVAVGMLTNILSNLVYDVGKKGVEKRIYSASKKDLIERLNETYVDSKHTQKELTETLNALLENQNLMFDMLSSILDELEMKTTFNIYNNQITFNVPASDVFKLQQIYNYNEDTKKVETDEKTYSLTDAISTTPTEDEIFELLNTVKEHFVVATPTKPKSKVFEKWYRDKCGKSAIFFEINKTSYYSISRAEIYKEIKHEPRIYVVDTNDLYNYTYYEVTENQSLSDGNNIVIKPKTNKGYIVAVSGTL